MRLVFFLSTSHILFAIYLHFVFFFEFLWVIWVIYLNREKIVDCVSEGFFFILYVPRQVEMYLFFKLDFKKEKKNNNNWLGLALGKRMANKVQDQQKTKVDRLKITRITRCAGYGWFGNRWVFSGWENFISFFQKNGFIFHIELMLHRIFCLLELIHFLLLINYKKKNFYYVWTT